MAAIDPTQRDRERGRALSAWGIQVGNIREVDHCAFELPQQVLTVSSPPAPGTKCAAGRAKICFDEQQVAAWALPIQFSICRNRLPNRIDSFGGRPLRLLQSPQSCLCVDVK